MRPEPLHYYDETFQIRAHEASVNNHVTLPNYCNYLQEVAGEHAKRIGFGIHALQESGTTWMLAHFHLIIHRYASWQEKIHIRTWPAGVRGRLVALRDFYVTDDSGKLLVQAVSEWMMIDLSTRHLARLPQHLAPLAPEGTPRSGVPELAEKIPDFEQATWSCTLAVRRSDLDFNNHVNNVHYVEWGLEPLPNHWIETHHISRMDITFRAEALHQDELRCEAAPQSDTVLLHRIVRVADKTILASMRTEWQLH
jgi:acyl-ACP thioesterase